MVTKQTCAWVNIVWVTTEKAHKESMEKCYQDTDGGPRLASIFERWDEVMLSKYNVSINKYDYNVREYSHLCLLQNYCSDQSHYLTLIHVLDKSSDYLLSSKYDPLNIGVGEVGLTSYIERD